MRPGTKPPTQQGVLARSAAVLLRLLGEAQPLGARRPQGARRAGQGAPRRGHGRKGRRGSLLGGGRRRVGRQPCAVARLRGRSACSCSCPGRSGALRSNRYTRPSHSSRAPAGGAAGPRWRARCAAGGRGGGARGLCGRAARAARPARRRRALRRSVRLMAGRARVGLGGGARGGRRRRGRARGLPAMAAGGTRAGWRQLVAVLAARRRRAWGRQRARRARSAGPRPRPCERRAHQPQCCGRARRSGPAFVIASGRRRWPRAISGVILGRLHRGPAAANTCASCASSLRAPGSRRAGWATDRADLMAMCARFPAHFVEQGRTPRPCSAARGVSRRAGCRLGAAVFWGGLHGRGAVRFLSERILQCSSDYASSGFVFVSSWHGINDAQSHCSCSLLGSSLFI